MLSMTLSRTEPSHVGSSHGETHPICNKLENTVASGSITKLLIGRSHQNPVQHRLVAQAPTRHETPVHEDCRYGVNAR